MSESVAHVDDRSCCFSFLILILLLILITHCSVRRADLRSKRSRESIKIMIMSRIKKEGDRMGKHVSNSTFFRLPTLLGHPTDMNIHPTVD